MRASHSVKYPQMRKFLKPALQWGVFLAVLGALFLLAFWLMFFKGLERDFQSAGRVVPSLAGKALPEAEALSRAQGLNVKIRDRQPSATLPAGVIISQEPPAGTPTRAAQQILLVVSAGKSVVAMPAVTGLVLRDAESQLDALKLKLGQVSTYYSQAQAGKVIAQSPPTGSSRIEGEKVALLVGKSPLPARFVMPDLVGRSTDAVRAFLGGQGFTVQIEGPGSGVVRKQFPLPGAPLLAGAQIRLESSAGLDPISQ
jgi:serine/threonine-protein kinase